MIAVLIAKRKALKAFDAINKRDIETMLKDWSEDSFLVYPGDIEGISGTYEGLNAIRYFYKRDFEQFPVLKITPQQVAATKLFDLIGNNTMTIEWTAEATNREGYEIQNQGITVMKIQGGKAVHVRQYIFVPGDKFRKAWSVTENYEG